MSRSLSQLLSAGSEQGGLKQLLFPWRYSRKTAQPIYEVPARRWILIHTSHHGNWRFVVIHKAQHASEALEAAGFDPTQRGSVSCYPLEDNRDFQFVSTERPDGTMYWKAWEE